MNGIHDIGGMDGFGPVQREENEPVFHAPWEGKLRAVHTLVSKKLKLYQIDESRHAVERIDPIFYLGSNYYQLWLLRTETLIMEKGLLTEEQITNKMAELYAQAKPKSHLEPYRKIKPLGTSTERKVVLETSTGSDNPNNVQPKYAPGTVVKAKMMEPLGHTRIPRYIRGKQGVIESIHGNFTLPDVKVHKGLDLYQPVYRVCFNARDLWGPDAAAKDKLYIELWEDYLEPGDC